jgi:uncharacterized SAM-binding protein YcdF (DUF218 family)
MEVRLLMGTYKTAAKWLVRALAALGLLVVVVSFTPLVSWWGEGLAGAWDDSPGETLVLLGGSSWDDAIIGSSSYLRCTYAIQTYRMGEFQKILISGGGERGAPISESMRMFLTAEGIPSSAITTETRSNSTRENALLAAPLLRDVHGEILLMTSDYHMFRAARAFRKAGIAVRPHPIPDVIKRSTQITERWPAFVDLVIESCKITYYFARGWI